MSPDQLDVALKAGEDFAQSQRKTWQEIRTGEGIGSGQGIAFGVGGGTEHRHHAKADADDPDLYHANLEVLLLN